MLSGLIPFHLNDWFSWRIYEMFPKSNNGTDIFFFGGNPLKPKKFTAWHIKPRSIFPHTRRYRLIRAICDKQINEVKEILDSGYDINDEIIDPKYGYKALTLAAALNRVGIIEYLFFRGANLDVQDEHGNTPLMIAVINWQYDTIKFLVEHGANIDKKDEFGLDAIAKAELRGLGSIVRYLNQQKNVVHEKNLPKFDIEFDFEDKLADPCDKLLKSYKYYRVKPIVYPFNNLSGTYVVNFISYDSHINS